MVGYGAEDNHFVVELTYNYGIGTYQMGNDFKVQSATQLFTQLFSLLDMVLELIDCILIFKLEGLVKNGQLLHFNISWCSKFQYVLLIYYMYTYNHKLINIVHDMMLNYLTMVFKIYVWMAPSYKKKYQTLRLTWVNVEL